MIRSLGTRLRLVLRQPGPGAAPDGVATDLPELDFVAYVDAGRLSGRVRLDAARLSDMLNEHEEFQLTGGVLSERLPDGASLVVPEQLVSRRELHVVCATGPRGDRARRMRTEEHRITIRLGAYEVTGSLHAASGVDPFQSIRTRGPMVPLTDAVLVYRTLTGHSSEEAGTLVVNRNLVDWVRTADPAPVAAHADDQARRDEPEPGHVRDDGRHEFA